MFWELLRSWSFFFYKAIVLFLFYFFVAGWGFSLLGFVIELHVGLRWGWSEV